MDARADAICARDIFLSVHVDFAEGQTSGLVFSAGELLVDGADLFAWSAPGGTEVGYEVLGAGEGGFEVRLAVDVYDF